MASKYPFILSENSSEQLKEHLSGINISLDTTNLKSGFDRAAIEAKDFASPAMYADMIAYYDASLNEGHTPDTIYDELVNKYQDYMANRAVYEHFIWLIISVNNGSITVKKTEKETTAYKYLTDEAKENVLQASHLYADELIVYLNENATVYKAWAAAEFLLGDIVRYNSVFYKCTEAHTAGETFDATKFTLSWISGLVIELDQVVNYNNGFYKCTEAHTAGETFDDEKFDLEQKVYFWQWSESDQRAAQASDLFTGWRDFNEYLDIDRSAYFYYKLRRIIARIHDDEIVVRTLGATPNATLLRKLKRAAAYKAMAAAIKEFDFSSLPANIRVTISNEMQSGAKDKEMDMVKGRLADKYEALAANYFDDVERSIIVARDVADGATEATPRYTIENTEDKPHAIIL
jgi:hypothetical protein